LRRARLPEPGEEPVEAVSGILFPSNGDNSVSNVRFQLSGAAMPNIVPLTLLWKVMPIQHAGFHSTFFHGRTDGAFVGDSTYFGCHPYPQGGSNGTTHNWEISKNGVDDIVDENGNSTVVVKGTVGSPVWFSQAARARNVGSDSEVDFWWDLRTSVNRRIHRRDAGHLLTNAASSPALMSGDAAWAPNNERLSGILRGLQYYQSDVSITHIQALEVLESNAAVLSYCAANSITPWYVNMNPTPSDITDKSGAGHHPAWVSSDHGTLWTP
jgi:hypothetical protein